MQRGSDIGTQVDAGSVIGAPVGDVQVFNQGADAAGAADIDHPALALGVQNSWAVAGIDPIGDGVAAPQGQGFADVNGLGKAPAHFDAGAITGHLDQAVGVGSIHRRLDVGVHLAVVQAGVAGTGEVCVFVGSAVHAGAKGSPLTFVINGDGRGYRAAVYSR